MKVTKEHYATIKRAIGLAFPREGKTLEEWRLGYEACGLSETRFLWDVARVSKAMDFPTLYAYCNDDHITTALRKAVAELITR